MNLEVPTEPAANFYESYFVFSFPFEWNSEEGPPLLRHLSRLLSTAAEQLFLAVIRAATALDRDCRWPTPEQQRLECLAELSL